MRKLLLILMVVSITAPSCQYMMGRKIKGNGNISTQEHSVTSFKNVQVSGAIDLYVSQGDQKPVKIETDENLQQYIKVEQQGDKIIIKFREGVNLRPTDKIKAYVTSPLYNTIDVSGASNILSQTKIVNTENMTLEVSGAGDINMDINAPAISAEISGAGAVNLKGETKTFDLTLTGAGKAHCYDMLSENTKVDISGAGDADVYASVKLDAQVSGAGSVTYKGGATNVAQQVSGAGSVKKVD
jgi:hypothetical protein